MNPNPMNPMTEEEQRVAEKPLFIPLKREFFDAFKTGAKTTEFRQYGPRWNERTCRVGRPVVISLGYGKQNRLHGVIEGFSRSKEPTRSAAWLACYGVDERHEAACIMIGGLRTVGKWEGAG